MGNHNDVILEEIRGLVNSYITTLQVKRSVLERLRQVERKRTRSAKFRHAVSGLKSTLRHLENREVTLLRTIEAKIAYVVGDLSIDNKIVIVPCFRAGSSTQHCYCIDKVSEIDIVKAQTVFKDENIDLERAGFLPDHPKIRVNINKLTGEVEFIVYVVNTIVNKFSMFKLPIHIIIRKLSTGDISLVKEVLRYCFEAEGIFEIFVPGDITFYFSVSSGEPVNA